MARVTVEDCLEQVPSRFRLVHLSVERVKQLRKGAAPLVESKNKEIVQALREIAAAKVSYDNIDELGLKADEEKVCRRFKPEMAFAENE